MESPLLKHRPLPLWELGDAQFEELCSDLWEKEQGIERAELYGRNGQKQRGVDILARRSAGGWSLGSCKAYQEYGVDNFDDAVEEFWQYRAVWKRVGAVAFIVFIGCSKRNIQLQDQYLSHARDFGSEGIHLELWDNRDLTDALRRNPDVGFKHLDPAICATLYGSNSEIAVSSSGRSTGELSIAAGMQEQLVLEFSAEVEDEIPDLRARARRGEWKAALELVEKRIESPRWAMLSQETRSKVLKLAAGLRLDALNDLVGAKDRLALAKVADPKADFQVLNAAIALREQDEEAALLVLEEPSTADAWSIRLSILINIGRAEEVLEIMKAPPFSPSGGTYRVASMAAVVEGRFDEAREYSDLAIKADPDGFHIRQLSACLKYLESVLPNFPEARFLGWPVPPRWEFVLASDATSAALDLAAAEFAALLSIVDADHGDRVDLEGWRLGCLANHPARQNEASLYAKELLEKDPCHLPALAWCMERGFQFERARSIRALEEAWRTDQRPELIQFLINLHILEEHFQEAADLLDRHRAIFKQGTFDEAWKYLRIQLAATAGDDAKIDAILEEESDPQVKAKLGYSVERVRAPRAGEWSGLLADAFALFESSGEPKYLFEACEISLIAGDGKFAAAHADSLLSVLQSPSSLLVAAHALLETGRFGAALDLLSRHEDLMGTGEINSRLLRVKTACLLKKGDPLNAIAAAKDLLRKNDTFDSKWMLFATQVEGSDFRGGAETARALVGDPEATSGQLIHIAHELWMNDPNLASRAFEKALEKGVSDRFLPAAMSLGFQLGKDKAASPLLQRIVAEAGKPGFPVTVLQTDDLRKSFQEKAQAVGRFIAAYRAGEIPLHFGYSHYSPLALQFWFGSDGGIPTVNGPTGLIRSGIHPVRSFEIGAGELYMDVSALIIASELGLLDLVEKSFAPISLSRQVIETLRGIATQLAPGQPSGEAAMKQILALIQEGRIHTFNPDDFVTGDDSSSGDARQDVESSNVWICTRSEEQSIFKPSGKFAWPKISPDQLAAMFQQSGSSANAVVDGDLPAVVQESLGSSTPKAGDVVLLDHGIAQMLAAASVLGPATDHFELRISTREKEQLEAMSLQSRSSEKNFKKAFDLAERVSLKIEQGFYRIVQRDEAISSSEESELDDPCSMSLADMGLAAAQGCKYVWCDDRFVTSFANYETATVAGVSEVLDLFRRRRQLTREEYFEAISQLRSKDYRYIPTSEEELIWAIGKAEVVDGTLIETPTLKALRRNIAACVLDAPSLRPPDGVSQMEYRWFAETFQAANGAIAELWADDSMSESALHAKCDYILHELGWPLSAPLAIAGKVPNQQFTIDCYAAVSASLMARGITLDWGKASNPNLRLHKRAKFYDWIASRLLIPFAEVMPGVVQALAKIEADALESQKVNRRGLEEDTMKKILLLTLLDLPNVVKSEVQLTKGFQDWLGVKPGNIHIIAGGVEFDANDFWKAISDAVKSGSGSVGEFNGSRSMAVSRFRSHEPWKRLRMAFDGFPPGAAFRNDATVAAVLPRQAARKYLEKRADWLDVDQKERVKVARHITGERDPAKRAARFVEHQSDSLEALYSRAASDLRARKGGVQMSLEPNSTRSLLNHLRISDAEVREGIPDLERCALLLVEDVGLSRAIERFVQLPIPLPVVLLTKLRSCSPAERRAVLSRVERKTKSPLGLIQAAHLFAIASEYDPQWLDRSRELVHRALETEESFGNWKFFHAVLTWAFTMLGALDRFKNCDGRLRILFAWLHAGRLTDVFIAAKRLNLERWEQEFQNDARHFGLELGAWETTVWEDCMHPRFAERCPVLVTALASIVSGLDEATRKQLRIDSIPGVGTGEFRDRSVAELFLERATMRNQWRSFLGGEGRSDFRIALSESFSPSMSDSGESRTLLSVVESLEQDPNQPDFWALLFVVLGDLPVTRDFEERLCGLIHSPLFDQLTKLKPSDWTNALLVAINRGRTRKDERYSTRVDELVSLYQEALKDSSKGSSAPDYAVQLMSCLVGRATVNGDEEATYKRFFGSLEAMIVSWPESTPLFDNAFWSWPNRWPLQWQSGYWSFALACRALC